MFISHCFYSSYWDLIEFRIYIFVEFEQHFENHLEWQHRFSVNQNSM